ncbi:MAG: Kelch repeat-containing protein [bacterium]
MKVHRRIAFALGAILVAATLTTMNATPAMADGTWTNLAPIAAGPRQENATVALHGKVYLLGGLASAVPPPVTRDFETTSRVERYDPATDTWTTLAPMPKALNHLNAAAVGGKIYVLGGMIPTPVTDYPWFAVGDSYVYDPATNAWSTIASMPLGTQRGASAVAVSGTKVYLAGGAACLQGLQGECLVPTLGAFSSYDTATNTWETLPSMPDNGRDHFPGVIDDGVMYTFGGRIGSISPAYPEVFAYNLSTRVWSTVGTMPTPRSGTSGALVGHKFYVMGGEGEPNSPIFDDNEAYNLNTGAWTILDPMPNPRHGTQAVSIGHNIYLPGGGFQQNAGLTDTNQRFRP